MEILKDKKVLIGGLLLLGAVGYYFMTKKKKNEESSLSNPESTTNTTSTNALPPTEDNYAVTLGSVDPTGAVWQVLGGKKYAFGSEDAWRAYGYSAPKTITKAEADSIPNGGFIGNDGKIIKAS
jgi:hypothetical protein